MNVVSEDNSLSPTPNDNSAWQKALFIDIETTGLDPKTEKIVEISVVDVNGDVTFQTLINPEKVIETETEEIHGISNKMVEGEPTLKDVWPQLRRLFKGRRIIAYNAEFDRSFFPGKLNVAEAIYCAMIRYRSWLGKRSPSKLSDATNSAGYTWTGESHRATEDAQACRAVWQWLDDENIDPVNSMIFPDLWKLRNSIGDHNLNNRGERLVEHLIMKTELYKDRWDGWLPNGVIDSSPKTLEKLVNLGFLNMEKKLNYQTMYRSSAWYKITDKCHKILNDQNTRFESIKEKYK
jgi:DNA polymerase III epsilon subunit-like protein